MLSSVPIEWLWLLALAATVIHCSAMATWIPVRRFRVAYPFVMVGCGAGAVAVGLSHFGPAAMLVMYAFTLIGLTIGLFPTRKLFMAYAHEIDNGVTPARFDHPRSHLVFCVVVVVALLFAGFALTR
ncbi:hypothetical protein ACFYW8_06650 [Streptomyces sp. NPDC002742]|uniref:hypothetical protein n=1 Tax=Streptomyces sp. NPDC002742 TaxID=3364663 RepID=UPI0036C0875C